MRTLTKIDALRGTDRQLFHAVKKGASFDFLPVGDHKRLPARFFARLTGADGSFVARAHSESDRTSRR